MSLSFRNTFFMTPYQSVFHHAKTILTSILPHRLKEGLLAVRDHYLFVLWKKLQWASSELRERCLQQDMELKRKNIERCHQFFQSGRRLRATGM